MSFIYDLRQNSQYRPTLLFYRPVVWNIPDSHPAIVQRPVHSHAIVDRAPRKTQAVAAPRVLPILQPPEYGKRTSNIQDEGKERKKDEKRDQPKFIDNEKSRKKTHKIRVEIPIFDNQRNYPRQLLPRRSVRPIRYAEPKYTVQLHFDY